MDKWIKRLVTLGPVGYVPASGTAASLLTALAIFFVPDERFVWTLFAVSLIAGLAVAPRAVKALGTDDPVAFVLDEVCGMAVTLLFLPPTPLTIAAGFALFRFFDTLKPLGIGRIDRWKHPAAITLDDVAAGLYCNIILRLAGLFSA